MPERDAFRRFLERILPWLNPAQYDREAARAQRAIARAEQVIEARYRRFDDVVRR